ncbi:MAG: trigger factor [Patescibacteria group bacterium]|jgi:trigger factor
MNISKKQLSKSEIELTIEVSPLEAEPYLTKAAGKISEEVKIPGFRPGKAPYDMVKTAVGEMAIYERALDAIIGKTLFAAMEQELKGAEITGQPQINLEKLVPGNPLVYKAVVTLVPEITLGDWQKIKVAKKEAKIDPKEIDKVLENLRQLRAKEEVKLGKLENGDKAVISFDGFLDRVALEGASAPEYPLVLGEKKFIPGFEEQLIGLSTGEEKEFEIRFPENYHQKNLVNKLVTFKVKVKESFRRVLPELNDDFAKALGGYDSLLKVKEGIESNLKQEAEEKESQRQEIAMLDELVKATKFSDLPESLVKAEAHRMVHELEHSIEGQGLKFEDYLTHIKKTEADLEKDFMVEGKKRVQTALITREIAKTEKLFASPEEIDHELEDLKKTYGQNPEAMENLASPSYRAYLANMLTNRKVIEFLKGKIIK